MGYAMAAAKPGGSEVLHKITLGDLIPAAGEVILFLGLKVLVSSKRLAVMSRVWLLATVLATRLPMALMQPIV